jgi:hypothetical protein
MVTPEFVAAVRAVVRWRRDHDVKRSPTTRWITYSRNRVEVFVEFGPFGTCVRVLRDDGTERVSDWRPVNEHASPATAEQVVDVLCALSVLPSEFSSQYRQGRRDGFGEGLNQQAFDCAMGVAFPDAHVTRDEMEAVA